MDNKIKFSVTQLDEYAKALTAKQVNMLYENKTHKKYKKMLCESHDIDDDSDFSIYLYNSAFEETGLSKTQVIIAISKIDKSVNYRANTTGIYFFTELPDVYTEILTYIKNNGLSEYAEGVSDGFEQYL